MTLSAVRQLGYESGIQLNPLVDNSEVFSPGISDQSFFIPMRTARGKLGVTVVNRSNWRAKLGNPEPIHKNELNEAMSHLGEALRKGAAYAVVYRMHTENAVNKFIVVTMDNTGAFSYSLAEEIPTTPYFAVIRHNECFNDGIVVSIHADAKEVDQPNDLISLKISDANGIDLYEFKGSLDPDSLDDLHESNYLPGIASLQLDDNQVEVWTGATLAIPSTSPAYGKDVNGNKKWAESPVQMYFDEGGTGYTIEDYNKAVEAGLDTQHNYAYIGVGGNRSMACLGQMSLLAYESNRQFRFDIPGELKPNEAIAFLRQLNFDTHLNQAFWTPLRCIDPIGVNGRFVMGTATLNIAMACARNARTNAHGFAPKNQPIAGYGFPIERQGLAEVHTPKKFERSDLAEVHINPVILDHFTSGSKYVFTDSQTLAKSITSQRKLIAVAEMATTLDDWIARYAKQVLQGPMEKAKRLLGDFMQQIFEDAQTAKWITPSEYMDGKAFEFTIVPNKMQPNDVLDLDYSVHYDGTVRRIRMTPSISR